MRRRCRLCLKHLLACVLAEAYLLFGRGMRAGVDRREQKKEAAGHEAELMRKVLPLRQRFILYMHLIRNCLFSIEPSRSQLMLRTLRACCCAEPQQALLRVAHPRPSMASSQVRRVCR